MYNLVVYGSLLNPKELEKHNIDIDKIEFVKVKGFKRIFNQEPSWRKVDSQYRAVMNIEPDENSWFNAILIKGLNEDDIKELDYRERGYDRTNIPTQDIQNYDGKNIGNCIVYKGKANKQNNHIFPNQEYFNICLEGAKSHFDEFAIDYINSTYKYVDGELKLI
jgi:hypothetical protein